VCVYVCRRGEKRKKAKGVVCVVGVSEIVEMFACKSVAVAMGFFPPRPLVDDAVSPAFGRRVLLGSTANRC